MRSFRFSQSGATAVEFALVVPLLIMAMVEILQGGLYLFCYTAIEHATANSTRAILVGSLPSTASTSSGFRTYVVCNNLISVLSCDNVVTSLQAVNLGATGTGYSAFVNADESGLIQTVKNNATTSYCPGAPGTYEYLEVFYAVPLFSPIWRAVNSTVWNGSTVTFARAAAAFRNEPFTSASVSTGC